MAGGLVFVNGSEEIIVLSLVRIEFTIETTNRLK